MRDTDFRKFISNFLHEHNLTVTELANGIDVKRQYLSSYLKGDIDSVDVEIKAVDWIKQWVVDNYPLVNKKKVIK